MGRSQKLCPLGVGNFKLVFQGNLLLQCKYFYFMSLYVDVSDNKNNNDCQSCVLCNLNQTDVAKWIKNGATDLWDCQHHWKECIFVLKIINSASAKSCELDPIPTTLLYENLDILLPTITNIINTSLTTGIVPPDLKTAIVKPLLKKPSLDKNLLKNYRPISNLPFLSKILEKVVLHKLLSHLQENNLSNPFQSAYRQGRSTETILLRIVNDILSSLDNDNISVLLLLDLSAAFDTLDHQILLSRLNSAFGIQSTALQWFHSYLSDRYQSTSVNNSSSSPSQLMYGVPQGSVLGPILFVLYTTPLSNTIANHSVNHQLFADDTQLQKSAPLSDQPHQRTQCMHRQHKNMDDGKLAQTERRQNRSSSLSLFVFLETFYRSPPWLDYSWLSQHPLLWFCQEPWIHSWLKTVHEEAHHKNLPNCLFRA